MIAFHGGLNLEILGILAHTNTVIQGVVVWRPPLSAYNVPDDLYYNIKHIISVHISR